MQHQSSNTRAFQQFLACFPPVEMPLTLGEDTHHLFSKENNPLPAALIQEFILPQEEENVDEFTEFVPCFSFFPNPDTLALVYWRASLLHYAYIIMTYKKDGKFISRSIISQSGASDSGLRHSAATIREDFVIYVAEGETNEQKDMEGTKQYNLEVLQTGEIIAYNAELN